ncbi:MAG: PIN domain-containing protein [Acidobacteriaceae bacterium]|nr:PIN domain-containing protein [Acidobacteriaceae bacterium]
MTSTPVAILDACVLANFALCDTLLRFAEFPELYEPRWSEEIMAETVRTLEAKLGWPRSLTESLQKELRTHFAEAWVSGYEPLVSEMTNDPKDRHVAAVAVHCKAEAVVTFNLRHFRPEHLLAWNISAIHPDDFLIALYHRNPDLVTAKLQE